VTPYIGMFILLHSAAFSAQASVLTCICSRIHPLVVSLDTIQPRCSAVTGSGYDEGTGQLGSGPGKALFLQTFARCHETREHSGFTVTSWMGSF
jgi:hypothetical protein